MEADGDVKLSVLPNIDVKELEENQKILNEVKYFGIYSLFSEHEINFVFLLENEEVSFEGSKSIYD